MIKKGKETFSGYNKPKRTPSHPTKSHAVLATWQEQRHRSKCWNIADRYGDG